MFLKCRDFIVNARFLHVRVLPCVHRRCLGVVGGGEGDIGLEELISFSAREFKDNGSE